MKKERVTAPAANEIRAIENELGRPFDPEKDGEKLATLRQNKVVNWRKNFPQNKWGPLTRTRE